MAWVKCNAIQYIPPIPVETFTTGVHDNATAIPGGTRQIGQDIPRDYPLTTIINTKKVASMTVHVKWWARAYASSSYGPSWQSRATADATYTFRVNNITDPGKYYNDRNRCESDNNGWVDKSGEFDFTFSDSDLPDDECEFFMNVHQEFGQNGDQLDPIAEAYISFTITSVTYKA